MGTRIGHGLWRKLGIRGNKGRQEAGGRKVRDMGLGEEELFAEK